VVFDGGVVLGADTRSTNGEEVAEKNCEKIHYVAPNIYCCGAGTAADTEKTTELISSQLELLRMETHSESRVVTAMTKLKRMLHRYQGYVSAALVLGGCDANGAHLYQIYPHGSTGRLPYTSMGSGSLAAIAVLETSWKSNMDENTAITLVQRAICAGIFNDLGSGSNCDITVIRTADRSVDIHRNMIKPNPVEPLRAAIERSGRLTMRAGLTPVVKTEFVPHPPAAADAAADADAASEMEVED
jgi:20S proteasome subunit beta 2